MLTRTYSLDDINPGYSYMHAGVNLPRRARVDQPTAASSAASAADPVELTQ
jgi:hypothetical protein